MNSAQWLSSLRRLPSGLLFLPVFALIGGLFLPLATSPIAEKAALYHSAQKLSLNEWYFYFFKDPFFLNFDFKIFAPASPLVSLMAPLLSKPVVIFLAGVLLAWLFITRPLPRETPLLRTLALLFPFFFGGYGELLTIWIILWAAWLFFHNENQPETPANRMWHFTLFAGLAAIISPGSWPLFWILWGPQAAKQIGSKLPLSVVLSIVPVSLWAMTVLSVSPSEIFHYLALPVTAWLQKYAASGESYLVSIPENLIHHVVFYGFHFVALGANLYTIYRRRRQSFFQLALPVAALLILSLLITRGESLYYLSAAVAITLFYPGPDDSREPSPWLWAWIIPALVSALLLSPEESRCQPEAKPATWVVSIEDLDALDTCPQDLIQVELLDTKIIPSNVKTLTEEPLAHDDKPIMNQAGIDFLQREKEYAASIFNELGDQSFHVLIRTRIHPAREETPYRRIHTIWTEMMQTSDVERRLVLR